MDKIFLQLRKLYSEISKHSNYQILPKKLNEIIGNDKIKVQTRHEKERLAYIFNNINMENKSILDIGGNSGYFTFEMIENGAKNVRYYEGNKTHCEFVKIASEVLKVEDKIKITNNYFNFDDLDNSKYDIVLLLNVLHHIGDDYGNSALNLEEAKNKIIRHINNIAKISNFLAFQLGFNWKGNKNLGLFENGTKRELIDFIKKGTDSNWEIIKIGAAQSFNGEIEYVDLNEDNIERDDSLGEFLNRPIFIMKSLR